MLPSPPNKPTPLLKRGMKAFVCNRVNLLFFVAVLVVIIGLNLLVRNSSPTPTVPDFNQETVPPVVFVTPPSSPIIPPVGPTKEKQPNQQREWCETDGVAQLGNHVVFVQFENWLKRYEKTYFQGHDPLLPSDPRHHLHAVTTGLRLSRTRADVLKSLITYDPRRALEVAILPERSHRLPPLIRENMEVWHSQAVDLKAVHVCFNHKTPEGRIRRWATLPSGATFEAFVYGKRAHLPTLSKVAVSGISLGDRMAISENAYRIIKKLPDERVQIEYAGSRFSVDRDDGLKALDRRIRQAELMALRTRRFQTPLIASSLGGSTNLVDLKYELVTTPMTWEDAHQTASQKKGRLVCIGTGTENKSWCLTQKA